MSDTFLYVVPDRQAVVTPAGPPNPSPTIIEEEYYGRFYQATLCRHFMWYVIPALHEDNPCKPPPAVFSPGTKPPSLRRFIAYALYCAQLGAAEKNVMVAALYLLRRFTDRYPAMQLEDSLSGHRVFLTIFMIAAKFFVDQPGYQERWARIGQLLGPRRAINQMERTMVEYMDWDFNINSHSFVKFKEDLAVFCHQPPYHG
jgi:hypothetical protein